MIKIIGTESCPRCMMVKKNLEKNEIPFQYILNTELDELTLNEYMVTAKKENITTYPLMIRDDGKMVKNISELTQ